MKPTSFNYAEYARLQTEMERKNEYVNALITERNQARLDCAVAEANHMRTLERFLEAQERIDELQADYKKQKEINKEWVDDYEKLIAENKRLQKQLDNAINELCQKCGRYREAHNGACNGCKWHKEDTANDK